MKRDGGEKKKKKKDHLLFSFFQLLLPKLFGVGDTEGWLKGPAYIE